MLQLFTLLLSLLPPSCMVVLIRELANNIFSTLTNIPSYTPVAQIYFNLNMENDIDMGPPRGRSSMLSKNNSKDSSIISTMSSKPYYEYIEIQNDNPS